MTDYRAVGRNYNNWGRWGALDKIGTLNHITEESLVGASRLVKRGVIFDLGIKLGSGGPSPNLGGRTNPIHHMSMMPGDTLMADLMTPEGVIVADDWITMPLQCASHWDGLGHIGYDGCFYNNVPSSSITALGGSTVLSIDDIVSKGVVGRGVLLDIASLHDSVSLEAGYPISAGDLEAAERRQGVRVQPGDILLIRTGWIRKFTVDRSTKAFWAGEPGIDISSTEWLWKREIAAVASDNFAVEVVRPKAKFSLEVHCVLIRDMGMTLGEIFDLEGLAEDCRKDGVWEFFFTGTPLKVVGGVGSIITPLAIK